MGTAIASPQARLLTLTSRMHDLELQCMRYSNEEIMNAMKSSNIAIKYNEALNKANEIAVGLSPTSIREYASSYQSLKYQGSTINYGMLKDMGYDVKPTGVSGSQGGSGSGWKMPTTVEEFARLMDKMGVGKCFSSSSDPSSIHTLNMFKNIDENGEVYTYPAGSANSAQYWASQFATSSYSSINSSFSQSAYIEFDQAKLEKLLGPMEPDYTDAQNLLMQQIQQDSEAFIEAILKGQVAIFKDGSQVTLNEIGIEEVTEASTQSQTIMSLDTSARDTARQAAEKEYETAMAEMKREDKVLQMKMKNANTQYQATCTEYESVKSLISENAETGFNIFS